MESIYLFFFICIYKGKSQKCSGNVFCIYVLPIVMVQGQVIISLEIKIHYYPWKKETDFFFFK